MDIIGNLVTAVVVLAGVIAILARQKHKANNPIEGEILEVKGILERIDRTLLTHSAETQEIRRSLARIEENTRR